MKFKTDENVPAEIAAGLRLAGYDAMTVVEQALAGETGRRVAAVCQGAGLRLLGPTQHPSVEVTQRLEVQECLA